MTMLLRRSCSRRGPPARTATAAQALAALRRVSPALDGVRPSLNEASERGPRRLPSSSVVLRCVCWPAAALLRARAGATGRGAGAARAAAARGGAARGRRGARPDRARAARRRRPLGQRDDRAGERACAGCCAPEQERERRGARRSVEETGRQALAEMRRLLGDPAQRRRGSRRSRRSRASARCDALRRAGPRGGPAGRAERRGRAGPRSPAGVDLSAYRIVQEALTNALRHAGPARAWVVRTLRPTRTSRSRSRTTARPTATADGDGHGLVGMRERVALYGGELAAGPAAGRRVHVVGAAARDRSPRA